MAVVITKGSGKMKRKTYNGLCVKHKKSVTGYIDYKKKVFILSCGCVEPLSKY